MYPRSHSPSSCSVIVSPWPRPRLGLCCIVRSVLKLVPHGLLIGGPPCGSWTFINKGTSRRSWRRIFGNTQLKYIRDNNKNLGFTIFDFEMDISMWYVNLNGSTKWTNIMALVIGNTFFNGTSWFGFTTLCIELRITCRWVLLGMLAAVRSVLWLTEQPRNSMMGFCPYFRFAGLALAPTFWGDASLSET